MYPIIRLPRDFRELAGSRAEIYQTSYEGSLAFLVKVVDRASEKLSTGSNNPKLPEPSHGGGRRFESGRAHRLFLRSFGENKTGEAADAGSDAGSFEPPLGGVHIKQTELPDYRLLSTF
ncbi:MAG: hypothetical protein ACXV5H_12210 [Halobacteriota archaeon]